MRRVLFNRQGEPVFYLTEAGVLYDLTDAPIAVCQDAQLVSLEGRHLGWFDGAFLRDPQGFILAFVKGAQAPGLELPPTRPLKQRLQPRPLAYKPLLVRLEPPEFRSAWSRRSLAMSEGPRA